MIYKKYDDGDTRYYKLFGCTFVKIENSKKQRIIYVFNVKIFTKYKKKYLIALKNQEILNISKMNEDINCKLESSFLEINFRLDNILHNVNCRLDNFLNIIKIQIDNINAYTKVHSKSFDGYKNKFTGKDIVILCTGPTYATYQQLNNVINIGVNRAYRREDIDLDFIFIQDINGLKDDINAINNYNPQTCVKFYGGSLTSNCPIPESDVLIAHANRYYTGCNFTNFYPDITSSIFPEYGSVVFSALNFAIYTHPRRIYLVGCDASQEGYFDSSKQAPFSKEMDVHLNGWNTFKKFRDQFYPDVEIISINPVGLKNIFKDVYQ